MTANYSTNDNVVSLFVSDLKIVRLVGCLVVLF